MTIFRCTLKGPIKAAMVCTSLTVDRDLILPSIPFLSFHQVATRLAVSCSQVYASEAAYPVCTLFAKQQPFVLQALYVQFLVNQVLILRTSVELRAAGTRLVELMVLYSRRFNSES